MSLPYSSIVPISAVVDSPAFTVEKKHLLLGLVNDLIPASVPYLAFKGASAVTDFRKYFGFSASSRELSAVQKYFSFLSKSGTSPEKLIVARWFKTSAAAEIKGSAVSETVANLKAVSNGSFNVEIDGTAFEVVVDLSSANSYSDIAGIIETEIKSNTSGGTAFTSASFAYNTTTKGFILRSGTTGIDAVMSAVTSGETGTDLSEKLALKSGIVSNGVDAESYAEFCDRIYNANTSGFSIATLEELDADDIVDAVAWLQGTAGGQTYSTVNRLLFNFNDKETAKTVAATLKNLSYSGYVLTFDPYDEMVHILDAAICASIDYETVNGSINFNFQPAKGYTALTTLGNAVDYQHGLTNSSLINELNELCISCVYSVGFGSQEVVYYGFGLMSGSYGTEDVQVNESALETEIQVSIINALNSLNKIKLQGEDAREMIGTLLTSPLNKFRDNGSIAMNGTLTDNDRLSIVQATGNPDAADAVANNGYYYQIEKLSAEDIAQRRVRVLICYLCGGVVNQVRIINRIYGA